ncbi:hypothetical protein ABC418_17190 [Lactiplantibacillus plantarum]|uniref:hypothetical protein n=1 Tax=Lactiplantibacillus plantarum TaxID=1590 RepID=UPI003965BF42
MNPQEEISQLTAELFNRIINEAREQPTYAKALQKLKRDQDKMADFLTPQCPLTIARAIAQVTNAIYGEAIHRLLDEAKAQSIEH